MQVRLLLLTGLCLPLALSAQELIGFQSGHVKGQYLLGTYPDTSLVRDLIGSPSHEANSELRLLIDGGIAGWSWQGDYQLVARTGDTLPLSRQFQGSFLVPTGNFNDDNRLMNLTSVIDEGDNYSILHRMDRLHVGYTGDKAVVRVGRQAVSWGNGLIYNPVDFFNPFDPSAIDKEFKTGDDMFYGQYLTDSGNDWQVVSVWRRDEDGHTGNAVNTTALKYHALVGASELDLLLAQHFEDLIASAGGIVSIGGAIVRGDIMITDTDLDTHISGVLNFSYSWVGWGKNMSGVVEYFHNGLGVSEKNYDRIDQNKDLVVRLARGELFTIGRDYLAGGVTVEVTPLLNVMPNMFVNLDDGSGLAQLVSRYDIEQNLQLLLALNLPFGDEGTEFGGLESPVPDRLFSSGPGVFVQLAWYF